jgi:triacylglycerol esterase/lipase EstA (alpha/beta hydrolase family)
VREPFWSWSRASEKRIAHGLARAALAWDAMAARGRRTAQEEREYEDALASVLKTWASRQNPSQWQDGTEVRGNSSTHFILDLPPPSTPAEFSPQCLDRLMLADEVRRPGDLNRAVQEGLGVPIVAQVLRPENGLNGHGSLPPNGAYIALTAIVDFKPAPQGLPRHAVLRFFDPMRQTATRQSQPLPGKPLAADYTAARVLALDRKFLSGFSLAGLLYPEKVLADSRLHLLDAYDPKRIPVVFVHGLMSDPHIWLHCVHAIAADERLRRHYQPWYFLYPTGLAVPATASRLRESLLEARQRLDPEGDDPGLRSTVLVGHSMGGLLSRLQAVDSGDAFWDAYFQRPPEELLLSDESRQELLKRLRFQRLPFVQRLVFITVPHRGSDLADKGLVMRLSKFIRLPVDTLLLASELMTGNFDALNPQIRDWGAYAFLSLGTLSPRHPYLAAMNAQPLSVPHHSIIGRIGKNPLEQSSDGVVPYASAHLPTGTECVVPHWHGCVEKPDVVAEVARRLHQHLDALGRK